MTTNTNAECECTLISHDHQFTDLKQTVCSLAPAPLTLCLKDGKIS